MAEATASPREQTVERLDLLRRERKFQELRSRVDEMPLEELAAADPAVAAAVLVERALVHVEFGRHADAQADYELAAELGGDPWIRAEAFVQAAGAATDREDAALASAQPNRLGAIDEILHQADRAAEREGLLAAIAQALRASADDPERAALRWARATIRMGLGPDDRSDEAGRAGAGRDVATARQLAPQAWRPAFAWARLARSAARAAEGNVERLLDTARQRLEAVRDRADEFDEHPWNLRAALDYERARIELRGWQWGAAREFLVEALRADPRHQAANVWLVYCDRMIGEPRDSLVATIDGLLREGEDGAPAMVVEPTLVAELRTERAAMIENQRVSDAEADYRAALSIRPRMWFARRGVIRCLDQSGRTADAQSEGKLARDLATELSPIGLAPPQLLVELARVEADAGNLDEAVKLFTEAESGPESYPFAWQAHVAALRQAERIDEALEVGKQAFEENGASALGMGGVRMEVGDTLVQDRNYGEALAAFRLALAEDDSEDAHERARLGVVAAYRQRRQLRAASEELGRVRMPMSGRATHADGWLRAEIGDYSGALRCFDATHKRFPRDATVMWSRARAMRQLGRPRGALSFLESAMENVPTKQRPRLLNEAAWTQLNLGDAKGAFERFVEVCSERPSFEAALRGRMVAEWWVSPSPEVLVRGIASAQHALAGKRKFEMAGIHNEAGACCAHVGDLPMAHRYFDQALELAALGGPELTELLLVMQAHALLDADALADAQVRINRVEASAEPLRDDPRATLLSARWRQEQGDADGALALYRRVHEVWKDCGDATLGMAAAYFARGEYESAEQYLAGANASDAPSVPAMELLVWTLVRRHEQGGAATMMEAPFLDRAVGICEDMLALERGHAGAYECLGNIALLRSQFAAADAYTRQAVARDPERAAAHRNRAAMHMRLARYGDAIGCLEMALRCHGPQAVTYIMLGFACTESGRDSDARDHLRRAIALEPSEPLAPDLLAGVLERGCDYSGAYEVLTRAVATVPRRHAARIHLGRARVLCAQAEESDTESKALLAHALREADHGLQIARTGTMGRHDMANIADAHYHRGVVLHRLGRPRPAGQAFEAARRAGDVHGAAERALTLLGEARGQADGSDRRVRWWGNVLAVVGVLLAVAAVVLEFWHGHWHAAEFRYFPVSYVAGGALLLAVLGAALPRLAGLSFGGQVEIRISEPRAVEPVAVTLAFERADSLPSTIMAGPGAMRIAGPGAMPPPGLPSDTVGNP